MFDSDFIKILTAVTLAFLIILIPLMWIVGAPLLYAFVIPVGCMALVWLFIFVLSLLLNLFF